MKRVFFLILCFTPVVLSAGEKPPVYFSWLYVSYGVDFEHWIDSDKKIERIDEIEGYATRQFGEEKPKTFQTLKWGGFLTLPQNFGIYMELPFIYNRVEPYQSLQLQFLSNYFQGQRTPEESVWALGDTTLGVNYRIPVSFMEINTALSLRFPSMPLGKGLKASRSRGAPWAGFNVFQIGVDLTGKWKKHFLTTSLFVVAYDPFINKVTYWVVPGDLSFYLFYVYQIKWGKMFNLKPGLAFDTTYYHWNGRDEDAQLTLNLRPNLSFSFFIRSNQEVSLSTSWSLFSQRRRGDEIIANTRSFSMGIYYGIYR